MALRATVFKAELAVSDMDRGRHATHGLTIARHPSETDERMMVRVLTFALHSSDRLAFGRGLSDVDEPDLIDRDMTGSIDLWIEVGLPDERAILKACGRAGRVVVMAYGHGGGLVVMYLHLLKGSIRVRSGELVAAGTELASIGTSGAARERHLHLQVGSAGSPIASDGAPFVFHAFRLISADATAPIRQVRDALPLSGDLIEFATPLP